MHVDDEWVRPTLDFVQRSYQDALDLQAVPGRPPNDLLRGQIHVGKPRIGVRDAIGCVTATRVHEQFRRVCR